MANLTHKDRQTPSYKYFLSKFKDGYYIEKSTNQQGYNGAPVILYQLIKDTHTGKLLSYYLAYDIAVTLSREFKVKIREAKKISIWLNDNPHNFKPIKGHKIAITYS